MPESTPILRHPPPDPRQLRNREETLPASARATGSVVSVPSLEELREARHLLAVTAVVGITFGLVAVVFFELLTWSMKRDQRGEVVTRDERTGSCREDDLDSCPIGQVCRAGSCVNEVISDLACQDGDTCDAPGAVCECRAPFKCVEQTCVAPPATPAVCDKLDVQELLDAISAQCKGDFLGCPDTELKNFVVSSKTFDQVLARFPETITVHFPSGSPAIRGPSNWPDDAVSAYYRERVTTPQTMQALREAKVVLMIARSSKGGSDIENLMYSRVRSDVIQSKLLDAAASQAERETLEAKFKHLALGARKSLTATLFRRHYHNRMFAWGLQQERWLRAKVANYDKLSFHEKNRVDNILNQAVIIVPIPCELPGFADASGGE